MTRLMIALVLAFACAMAAAPSWAEKIDLENSDGTTSRLKGTNGAADVNCTNCSAEGGAAVAEDTGHTSGANGLPVWCVRYDDAISSVFPAALTSANLDYSPFVCDTAGRILQRLVVIGNSVVDTNKGVASNGTQRVAIAEDSGVCNPKDTAQVAVSVSASGNTQLVALTSGQTIYVCDIVLVARGAVEAQFIYGTGTACATGETDMSGPMSLIANTGFTNSPLGRFKTAAANALCLELSAAVQVDGYITYRKAATF
jgi:hypothetical protein